MMITAMKMTVVTFNSCEMAMKKEQDKTVQILKDQYDELGKVDAVDSRRQLRQARAKLKHTIHKRERNIGKRELREQLTDDPE